jgi:predicted nucleic acid-binding protein
MKSNDSIIAVTELLNNMEVYTRNIDDFKHITGLTIINLVLS